MSYSHDFGHADILDAEAIGQPGARRFRIFVRSSRGDASLWMERDQLENLMEALEKVLAQTTGVMTLRAEAAANPTPPPGAPDDFPSSPDVEFQAGPMRLAYDEDDEELQLRVMPLELIEEDGELVAREDEENAFSVIFSRSQAQHLCSSVNSLTLLGRPRCPFCGPPMQARHFCEKQNGFHPANLN